MTNPLQLPWEATYNSKFDQWTIRYTKLYYEKGEDRAIAQVLNSLDKVQDEAVAKFIATAPAMAIKIEKYAAELLALKKLFYVNNIDPNDLEAVEIIIKRGLKVINE